MAQIVIDTYRLYSITLQLSVVVMNNASVANSFQISRFSISFCFFFFTGGDTDDTVRSITDGLCPSRAVTYMHYKWCTILIINNLLKIKLLVC